MRGRVLAGTFLGALILIAGGLTGHVQVPTAAPIEGAAFVVTQTPSGTAPSLADGRFHPDLRYPAGSRIILVQPGGGERILSGDLLAAGSPAVAPSADWVVFSGKSSDRSHWTLYRTRLSSGGPDMLLSVDRDCTDPAWLPKGGIVVSCRDLPRETSSWSLYTTSVGGDPLRRITFGPGSASDPSVLADGRVIFSMTLTPGTGLEAPGSALFTVNPDGTLLEPFRGVHDDPPSQEFRPRRTPDTGVLYLAAGAGDLKIQALRVPLSRPMGSPDIIVGEKVGASFAAITSVEPMADGQFLVAGVPPDGRLQEEAGPFGVYSLGRDGLQGILDTREWNEIEAIAVSRSPASRARPSAVNTAKDSGVLICYDSSRSDGVIGPRAGSETPASLVIESLPPDSGRQGSLGEEAVTLLRKPIERDGSFMVDVPADRALRVRTLDTHGGSIATSGWFWVRPGEVRGCFGCHERRREAPVNRPVMALRSHLPVDQPTSGVSR